MLLAGTFAFSQFTLEHTYPENFVTRVKLENSGEKYYLYDDATGQVKLYNADHTPWKTVDLGLPSSATLGYIESVSETAFNTDANLEISFAYYISGFSGYTYYSSVVSESGATLLDVADYFYSSVNHIEGLSDKLILSDFSGNTKVYSMPGLALEHSYTGGQIFRTKLDNSGEKYFQLNAAASQARIYNSDHTLWKTISAPKPSAATYSVPAADDISETTINDDALVELIYNYTDTGITQGYIVNEAGATLFDPGSGALSVNNVEGLGKKLFLTQTIPTLTTSVYSLPSPSLEHTYMGNVVRTKLEISGEKYYTTDASNTLTIYNSDHSVWKTIILAMPAGYHNPTIGTLSESAFAADPLVEVSYAYYNDSISTQTIYQGAVINENGNNLLTVPGAASLYLSRFDGLQDKLIALLLNVSGSTYDYGGSVYSINPTMATHQFSKDAPVIFPNPASDILNIHAAAAIAHISLYSAAGRIVMDRASTDRIDVSGLPAGFYLLQVTDVENTVTAHKIVIAR